MGNFSEKYRSLELISNDKSKLTYAATNTETNERVTLNLFDKTEYEESKFEELKRFVKFSNLNKSDNILKIYNVDDGWYNDFRYYFVEMENIKGNSLESLLESKEFNENEALKIIRQLINGLQELHRLNVVYKNLSTEKIFIDENGNLKLDITGYIDKYNQTIKYISPEQVINKPINKTSDIYSIGIILYEMMNKELPFNWENGKEELYKSMTEDFYISKEKCGKNVLSILENCLYIDPSDRYENLDVLLLDVNLHIDHNVRGLRSDRENEVITENERKKVIANVEANKTKEDNKIKRNEENDQLKEDNRSKKNKYIKIISTCAAVALVAGGLKVTGEGIINNLKNKNESANVNISNEENTTKDNEESTNKENQEDNTNIIPTNKVNTENGNTKNKSEKANEENNSIDIENTEPDNNQTENDITTPDTNQNTDNSENNTPNVPQTPEQTPSDTPSIPQTPEQTPGNTPSDTPQTPNETPGNTPQTPEQTPSDTPGNTQQTPEQTPSDIPDNTTQTPEQTPNNTQQTPNETPQESN